MMDDDTAQPRPPDPASALAVAAADPAVDECDVCCDAMPALVLHDLSRGDADWLIEHTRTCGYCRRKLVSYERVESVLDTVCTEGCDCDVPPARVPQSRRAGYAVVESPVGPLFVAASEAGVCEIAFGGHEHEQQILHHLRGRGFRPVPDQQAVNAVADQLHEYFRGERNRFSVPFDVSGVSAFTKQVLEATAEVPFGHLTSYRGIAERIGQPGATRAVGNALGRNPIPVVIPCHRIVRSDSSIGGYTGGIAIKEHLLALEGVLLPTH